MISRTAIGMCGALALALLLAGGSLVTGLSGARAANSDRGEKPDDRIAALVRQLGDVSFLVRERASRDLVRIGISAQPALTKAAQDSDPEVSARARQTLETVLEADFQARLEAFAADVDQKAEHELPGWKRFQALLGGKPSRTLFVAMQRAEPDLLEALDKDPKTAGELFSARCTELQQGLPWQNEFEQVAVDEGTIATLLLVGVTDGVTIEEQSGLQFSEIVRQQLANQGRRESSVPAEVKKLIGTWITKDHGPMVATQNLILAINSDFSEGLTLAERVLQEGGAPVFLREYALLAISKLGNAKQLPVVEPYLTDTAPIMNGRPKKKSTQTEVRDIALATLVHLTGQDLKAYGFEKIQANSQANPLVPYNLSTISFADADKREAALRRWQEWSAAQQK